ncbi:hypothetical protein BDV27DRAFT_159716 [Aspergillus caelatus]|uniref:Uncharacterized protein n=2 Tax=Aspergillus subgen. Circumdati TaxID=2720871 RepID=A0A5N6ZY98_9EURO|nr:uncharacterized protein BDV27DRAFT_159716 [Aspergillus caelatus]KAE8362502.1 hypothetical protein BDV27DRAFT_159716 [Aspergillus caelatus]KAE8416057.1 hypothetical protein BDV36DRAFT_297422 [Aspergillus pseudocaelatus]
MYFHLELSIKVYRVTGLLRNNDDSIRTAKAWTSQKGEEVNEYKYPPLTNRDFTSLKKIFGPLNDYRVDTLHLQNTGCVDSLEQLAWTVDLLGGNGQLSQVGHFTALFRDPKTVGW